MEKFFAKIRHSYKTIEIFAISNCTALHCTAHAGIGLCLKVQ